MKVELGCCPVWSLWFTGHVGIGYQLDSSVQAKCSMMCFLLFVDVLPHWLVVCFYLEWLSTLDG